MRITGEEFELVAGMTAIAGSNICVVPHRIRGLTGSQAAVAGELAGKLAYDTTEPDPHVRYIVEPYPTISGSVPPAFGIWTAVLQLPPVVDLYV
jgi:hypothetical protein